VISFSIAFAGVGLFLKDDALGAIAAVSFAIFLRLCEPQFPA
jgi:hypothetical protein